MTEHISRSFECDVSGETITQYRNMLVLETVGPSSPFTYNDEDYERTLHISSEAHPFDSTRLDHDFRAFITDAEQVCLIEEDRGYGQMSYHGRETADEEITDLFATLQGIVDGWDVPTPD